MQGPARRWGVSPVISHAEEGWELAKRLGAKLEAAEAKLAEALARLAKSHEPCATKVYALLTKHFGGNLRGSQHDLYVALSDMVKVAHEERQGLVVTREAMPELQALAIEYKKRAEAAEAKLAEAQAEKLKLEKAGLLMLTLRDKAEVDVERLRPALQIMYDEWMDQGHCDPDDPDAPLLCMHSAMAERMARAALRGGGE